MRLERAVAERQAAAERGDSGEFVIWLTRERFYRRLREADFNERLHPRDRLGRWYHGTNVALKPGAVLRPSGKVPPGASPYYQANKVYFSNQDHLAERYAVSRAGKLGGTPHVYEVSPVGKASPDPEQETGFSKDQFVAGEAKVIKEVPLPGLVHWDNGMLKRGPRNYVAGRGVDIGVTPYRGAGKAHGEDYYNTSRYKGFESYAQNHARDLGVDLVGVDHTAGIWEGQTEPSASVRVRGAADSVRQFAADLAEHFQQDGAVTFQRDSNGPNLMFRTSGQVDPDTARKAMQKHGVQGGRVRDGKIEVIDFDPTGPAGLRDKMRALAQELGLTVQYDRGSATLLAKGADYA